MSYDTPGPQVVNTIREMEERIAATVFDNDYSPGDEIQIRGAGDADGYYIVQKDMSVVRISNNLLHQARRKYRIVYGWVSEKIRGIYFSPLKIYNWFITQRTMCKMLKGGYVVIRNDQKREVVRFPLDVGFFSINYDQNKFRAYEHECIGGKIEFYTRERQLLHWNRIV